MAPARLAKGILLALAALAALAGSAAGAVQTHDAPLCVLRVDAHASPTSPYCTRGSPWRYPVEAISPEELAADAPERSVWFGERVRLELEGLDPQAAYRLRLVALSDAAGREMELVLDGEAAVDGRLVLPARRIWTSDRPLEPRLVADGRLAIELRRVGGPNAVLAALELWSSSPRVPTPPAPPRIEVERPRLTPRPAAVPGVARARLDLDGPWSFHPGPLPQALDPQSPGWGVARVPGTPALQGFDVARERPVAYRREVDVPADWAGRRVVLRFDAVYGAARVFVGGAPVGESERTFTPFELDVTERVTPGARNSIALTVREACDADVLTYGSGYARHPLVGVLRHAELFCVPPVHLARLHVETELDAAYRDATLRLILAVDARAAGGARGLELDVTLRDPAGAPVALEAARFSLPPAPADGLLEHVVELPVAAPLTWHPEHPHLYRLEATLAQAGAALERVAQRVGFRELEVRGGRLLVDGVPTRLRGINRHEAHPLSGRALGAPLWRRDAELLRAMNVNHVRTSHYPPAEEFLDACDELGLFVEVEAPITWVGHGANPTWAERDPEDPRLVPLLARFVLETIERDRSHPSVILWSLANESSWTRGWAGVAALARSADSTRPLVFHDQAWGGYNNRGSDVDVANMHYPGPDGPALAAELAGRPLVFGEYCHLNVYNRAEVRHDPGLRDAWGEVLAPMWEAMRASEGVLGGSIWSGVSDRFRWGDRWVGYGSWGPLDGWRRPKPEAWHVQKVYSPVRVLARSLPLPAPGTPLEVPVENRHERTDLAELRITWRIGERGGLVDAAVPPRTAGALSIPLEPAPRDGDVLELGFARADGTLVDLERLQLGAAHGAPLLSIAQGPPRVEERADVVEIVAGELRWRVDRATGALSCTTVAGAELVRGGPHLFAPALESRYTLWIEESPPIGPEPVSRYAGWRLEGLAVEPEHDLVRVVVTGAYEDAAGRFELGFDGAGRLSLAYFFTHRGQPLDLLALGVALDLPRSLDVLEWEREGQWSAYPDDHLGRLAGSARAFRGPGWPEVGPAERPPWPWALDQTEAGTNDFRATRRGLRFARLRGADGQGLELRGDGSQAARAWVSGERVRWVSLDYAGPGSETFLNSHHRARRRVLEPGDVLDGRSLWVPLSARRPSEDVSDR